MDGFKYFFVLPLQSLVDYIYICNGKEIDILKKLFLYVMEKYENKS